MILIPNQTRPRLWIKWFVNPILHKRGKGSCIRKRTRLDVIPWNKFNLGEASTIEDFTAINNGVGDVIIGNDVWIGANATILGGITIGDGAVIAAGAVVNSNVPKYSVSGGVPSKTISIRN